MNEYYNISKDYNELFDLICNGYKIAAFVDYDLHFGSGKISSRDICIVKRNGPYQIQISVRGICYISVDNFECDDGKEIDLFVDRCSKLNIEWIKNGN